MYARRRRNAGITPLHNFGDTDILRLRAPDVGIFVVVGRAVISNADGDQNATARLTTFDGAIDDFVRNVCRQYNDRKPRELNCPQSVNGIETSTA